MGDVILTTPLLCALRENLPEARITYLAEAPYHTLLEHHPCVDVVWGIERKKRLDQIKLFHTLLRNRFDVAIDLFGNPRSAWLTFLSGARIRIGGDFRGRRWFYTDRLSDDGVQRNAVDFHLRYLEPLGIQRSFSKPFVVVTEDEKARAGAYLESRGYDLGKRIIAIHPGASWPAKRWLPERFAALANRLVTEYGIQIYFIANPGDASTMDRVMGNVSFNHPKPEILKLRQLGAVLSCCDLLVSNDCGSMHLAPAVGTKIVGIFGPGEPEVWFPYRPEDGHRLVHHEIACSRCHRDFCDRMDCMKVIEVDEVYGTVMEVLGVGV